ncbi:hypothetical protein [Kordiimonas aquimaris]|uniref:hypothetical protein n=1 Tax=Kordiimonas aquimaris TaxID=707591 RepID=UPI0021CF2697|nr:hypothetical protein [Kordiimonas aquimaris]
MKTLSFSNILMAISALLLIGFGAPRFLASIWMAAGDPILQDIAEGKTITEDDQNVLIESRETALSLVDMPRAANDLSLAYVALGATPEKLEKAIASVKASIEMAPISESAWRRLANLQAINPNDHAEAVIAWETARKLSEHEPQVLHDRIRVGTFLYRSMTEEQRALLRMDVETAYKNSRGSLRNYGRANDLLEWLKFLLRDKEKTDFLNR